MFTLVLIDADPEHAEDGDFIFVQGVSAEELNRLSAGSDLQWTTDLAVTALASEARDAPDRVGADAHRALDRITGERRTAPQPMGAREGEAEQEWIGRES